MIVFRGAAVAGEPRGPHAKPADRRRGALRAGRRQIGSSSADAPARCLPQPATSTPSRATIAPEATTSRRGGRATTASAAPAASTSTRSARAPGARP